MSIISQYFPLNQLFLQSTVQSMQNLISISESHPNIAFLYALVGNSFLAISQLIAKYATVHLTSFQLLSIRSFCLIAIYLLILKNVKQSPYLSSTTTFKLIMFRISLVGVIESLMFLSLTKIPVSLVSTIFNTSPIFAFFLEAIVYRKPLNKINLILTIISFVGVVLIIQPQAIFGKSLDSNTSGQGFTIFILCMLLVALGHATNMLLIHSLSKTVSPFVNLYYSHIGHAFVNGILNNLYPKTISSQFVSLTMILAVLGVTVGILIAQGGIVLANSLKPPSIMMPFGYAGVLVGFCGDVVLFGTQFTLLPILGIVMTSSGLLSGYLISRKSDDHVAYHEQKQSEVIINQQVKQIDKY